MKMYEFGLITVGLFLSPMILAQEIIINENHVNKVITCTNTITVNGNHVNLQVNGQCSVVTVNGNNNNLNIEQVGRIVVNGNKNRITYKKGVNQDKPAITNLGESNLIVQMDLGGTGEFMGKAGGVSVEKGGKILIADNEVTKKIECRSSNVNIAGNDNTITLTGECKEVVVSGNDNTVRIEAAEKIVVMGNDNRVKWNRGVSKPKPVVSVLGNDNHVDGP